MRTWSILKQNRLIGGGLLLSLCNLALFSLGFSSWATSTQVTGGGSASITAQVGGVNQDITINDGVFYVFGSEYSFDYYGISDGTNTTYYCSKPRIGFQIKLSPTVLQSTIDGLTVKPSSLYINTEISYSSSSDFDFVSVTNANATPPSYLECHLVKHPQYSFHSEEITTSYSQSGSSYLGKLSSKTLLYKSNDNSLLEFAKNLSMDADYDSTYIYFDCYYEFEVFPGFDFAAYQSLTLDYSISLQTRR